MLAGSIPLVLVKSVSGVELMQLAHLAVPGDFRHDRCGCDGRTAPISPDNRTLGHVEARNRKPIDQYEVREWNETRDGSSHREQRGAMHVEAVDLLRVGGCQRPSGSFQGDLLIEALSGQSREQLRVPKTTNWAGDVEDDGSYDDRASQTTASDLVDTCNAQEPQAPNCVLRRARRCSGGQCRPWASLVS